MDKYPTVCISCAFVAGILCAVIVKSNFIPHHHKTAEETSNNILEQKSGSIFRTFTNQLFEFGKSSGQDVRDGIESCIGNTPLIKIRSISEATGCDVFAKAEV